MEKKQLKRRVDGRKNRWMEEKMKEKRDRTKTKWRKD